MAKSVTAFLVFKIILHLIIFPIDVTLGIRLLAEKHWIWGILSLSWIAFGYLTSLLAVTIGKFSTGDFMSCGKFFLLALKVHAESVGAFFHSGPQCVTQLAIFWSGIYGHDFEVYNSVGTAKWLFALLEILSPVLNYISLVSTGVKHNNEPGPAARKIYHGLSVVFTSLLRVFIFSVMYKIAPLISLIITTFLYLVAVIVFSVCGEKWESVLLAYYALYLPCGHNNRQALKGGKLPFLSGLPEMERSRINHDRILSRVLKYFGLQLAFNWVLIAPLITFAEIWIFPSDIDVTLSPVIKSRIFVYCTGFTLTISSLVLYGLYFIQCRAARQAARTWTGLTPARSPLVATHQDPSTNPVVARARSPESIQDGSRPASQYSPSAPRIQSGEWRASGGVLPPGNRKCDNEDCVTCTWIIEGPYFYSSVTKRQYLFMTPVTCSDTAIIYLVTCHRCSNQYVGKTQNSLRERHYGHRREIDTQSSNLGKHFGEVCGINSWRIQIIDKCSAQELRSREAYWMHELRTLSPVGLNVRDEAGAPPRGGDGDARRK